MKQKIVLVGAGSAEFGYGMLGDIVRSDMLKDSTIVLHDINGEALSKVAKTAKKFVQENKLDFTIESTVDLSIALRGATFVIISIEVGDRFALWEMDRTIPQQYGINQIYGENGGPGGVFHSLRIIPPILDICGEIINICPDASVFCFTNPMAAICTTVNRRFPELKFYGMCHEIASLKRDLPDILDTGYDNLDLTAGGLNHFSVLLEAKYRDSGIDAYPDILKKAPSYYENVPGYSDIWKQIRNGGDVGFIEGATKKAKLEVTKSEMPWSDRSLFKFIMEKFDLLPITVDSHFGEYIGWAHDTADHRGILDFLTWYKYELTNVQHSINLSTKERVVFIIDGMLSDSGYREEAVNVPNTGLIKELPEFVSVEVPCCIDKNGVHGEVLPDLPPGYAALLRNYTGVYDLTADAVLKKSRKLVIQALLVNPVVNTVKDIDELVDQMISMQSKWLGYLE